MVVSRAKSKKELPAAVLPDGASSGGLGGAAASFPGDNPEALPIPPEMPKEALPSCPRKGKTSYTIKGECAAVVEVSLAKRAFVVKKCAAGTPMPAKPNFAWSCYDSIQLAWDDVSAKCCF